MTDETTYTMTLDDLRTLADAVSELDGFSARFPHVRQIVIDAHSAIMASLGDDIDLVYAADDDE